MNDSNKKNQWDGTKPWRALEIACVLAFVIPVGTLYPYIDKVFRAQPMWERFLAPCVTRPGAKRLRRKNTTLGVVSAYPPCTSDLRLCRFIGSTGTWNQ
jgi:hypothetical protein